MHALVRCLSGWVLSLMKGTLLLEKSTYLFVCVSKCVNSQNLCRDENEYLTFYVYVGVVTGTVSILDPSFAITVLQ
jgi:hypothetical protein